MFEKNRTRLLIAVNLEIAIQDEFIQENCSSYCNNQQEYNKLHELLRLNREIRNSISTREMHNTIPDNLKSYLLS